MLPHVDVINSQDDLAITEDLLIPIIAYLLETEGVKADEVAVHFVSEEQICNLHRTYFNDPSPTDTISFPVGQEGTAGYRPLGDVFVCPKVAMDYVVKQGGDPYLETTLYVVHGLLHLLGYKDETQEEQLSMRKAEERHIKALISLGLILRSPR